MDSLHGYLCIYPYNIESINKNGFAIKWNICFGVSLN